MTCGPGTVLAGSVCELPDAGGGDAGIDAPLDAPDSGSSGTSAATSFGLDPAHDNVQPTDAVASPLSPTWTATLTGPVSYPLVVNGVVFVAAAGSQPNVRALDLTTGSTLWGPIALANSATLAYESGRVFVLDFRGNLTALDAATGSQLWSIQVPMQPFYFAPPLASGGVLYLDGVGSGGTLVAIDEQTGTVRWTMPTGGTQGCAAIANGVLYVDDPCEFMAMNAVTAAPLWTRQYACSGGGGEAPSVYETKIWDRNASWGNLILDESGTFIGAFAATALPAFHGGVAFYPTTYGLLAVDIATSMLRWSFTGDGHLCTSPVVAGAGGQVFVASQSGKVYELDEATGTQRSVHDVGIQVTCFDETHSITLAQDHLLVPAGNELVVY